MLFCVSEANRVFYGVSFFMEKIAGAVKMWGPPCGVQGLWEGGKTSWFSKLSMVRHFHGALTGFE
jgi:hypothetical protein